MAQLLHKRIFAAIGAFALGLTLIGFAARDGDVRLGAGDLELIFQRGEETAFAIKVGDRQCPPECGLFDVTWDRGAANPTLLILSANRL